jgi:DNA polymerase III gamma/tau subunit
MNTYMNISWLDKYRPTSLDTLNTHETIITSLTTMKFHGSIPNLVCYGPSGSGKTTTMTAFGNEIYGNSSKMNMMVINASDERGITTIREKIIKFVDTHSLFSVKDKRLPRKMVILDESDYMTEDAQYAITNIIDDYPDILFVFICNYIYKIHDIIQSRCLTLYFSAIPVKNIKGIIATIVKKEKINISIDAVQLLCDLSNNDMRTALYMLQSMNYSYKRITPKNIYSYYQHPTAFHISKIIEIVKDEQLVNVYSYITNILHLYGIRLNHIITNLYDIVIANDTIPEDVLRNFIVHFADVEYNLTYEHTNEIMIGSLACGLWIVRAYL